MARQITLEVPDAVASHFVIATAEPPDDVHALTPGLVRRGLAAPLRDVVLDLLGTPLLEIRTMPVIDSPYGDLLETAGADDEERARLEKATHHVVVVSHAPPLAQPEHAQASRALARVLAVACDGVIADLRSQQVLGYESRLADEPVRFRLADDWLAVFITADDDLSRSGSGLFFQGEDSLCDPLAERWADGLWSDDGFSDRAVDCQGDAVGSRDRADRTGSCPLLRVESAGLHRFGLPDLEARAVPPQDWWLAVGVIRGAAVALLMGHWEWLRRRPGEEKRRIGNHLWVESADVWRYWAVDPDRSANVRVRVRLRRIHDDAPGAPPYLELGPPTGYSGAPALWWRQAVRPVVPSITSVPSHIAAA